MKKVMLLVVLLLSACWQSPVDFGSRGGETQRMVYAKNSAQEPIHITLQGTTMDSSNKVEPGQRKAMSKKVTIREGIMNTTATFIAGRQGRTMYTVNCVITRGDYATVEFTGSALTCDREVKGKDQESDPESGTGTTG